MPSLEALRAHARCGGWIWQEDAGRGLSQWLDGQALGPSCERIALLNPDTLFAVTLEKEGDGRWQVKANGLRAGMVLGAGRRWIAQIGRKDHRASSMREAIALCARACAQKAQT